MGATAPPKHIGSMIDFIDWWRIERPGFIGSAALHDAAEANDPDASAHAIARMFVMHASASLIGDKHASFVDGPTAGEYLVKLIPLDDPEAGVLMACLIALQRQDLRALTVALHGAATFCATWYLTYSARSLAQLSYRAALETGSWQDALNAAYLLYRVAILDENPAAAERWEARVHLHRARVQSATPRV
jgi:hypothetical protein